MSGWPISGRFSPQRVEQTIEHPGKIGCHQCEISIEPPTVIGDGMAGFTQYVLRCTAQSLTRADMVSLAKFWKS